MLFYLFLFFELAFLQAISGEGEMLFISEIEMPSFRYRRVELHFEAEKSHKMI